MSESKNDHAYVWLMMCGDRYLPGVLASAYSVHKTRPAADLVVMVTPDVTIEAITRLSSLAHVVQVPYIEFDGRFNFNPGKHADKYSSWINKSYTKWNCLNLPYKKVFLLDADTIVLENIDRVFGMDAPVGVFQQRSTLKNDRLFGSIKKDNYGFLQEGQILKPGLIRQLLKTENRLLATATSILLEPNNDVKEFIKIIGTLPTLPLYPNTTGVDEQSMAYYQSIILGRSWTVLHSKWNAVPWWQYGAEIGDKCGIVLHYMSKDKPWERDANEFPELKKWADVYEEAKLFVGGNRDDHKNPTDGIVQTSRSLHQDVESHAEVSQDAV
jgi:hypothetical protein